MLQDTGTKKEYEIMQNFFQFDESWGEKFKDGLKLRFTKFEFKMWDFEVGPGSLQTDQWNLLGNISKFEETVLKWKSTPNSRIKAYNWGN